MTSSPRHRAGQPPRERGTRTDRPAGLVRVTTFHARSGQASSLLDAAEQNARAARSAAGCHSAEVCTAPDDSDTVLVISRWASAAAVQGFLDWHQRLAYGVVSPHTTGRPHSVHYPVATAATSPAPG
jgi:quinol monooxygenase YgiN